jgi:hypothetical protein
MQSRQPLDLVRLITFRIDLSFHRHQQNFFNGVAKSRFVDWFSSCIKNFFNMLDPIIGVGFGIYWPSEQRKYVLYWSTGWLLCAE